MLKLEKSARLTHLHVQRVDNFSLIHATGQFNKKGYLKLVLLSPYFIEIPACDANSADPDRTPFCGVRSRSTLFANVPFMTLGIYLLTITDHYLW